MSDAVLAALISGVSAFLATLVAAFIPQFVRRRRFARHPDAPKSSVVEKTKENRSTQGVPGATFADMLLNEASVIDQKRFVLLTKDVLRALSPFRFFVSSTICSIIMVVGLTSVTRGNRNFVVFDVMFSFIFCYVSFFFIWKRISDKKVAAIQAEVQNLVDQFHTRILEVIKDPSFTREDAKAIFANFDKYKWSTIGFPAFVKETVTKELLFGAKGEQGSSREGPVPT